jgi:Zn-dependent membrane protease YugP
MFIDPLVYMALAPAVLVPLWARARTALAFARASRRPTSASGVEAAAAILRAEGIEGVAIVAIDGPLSDVYDPGRRTLRLSTPVHDGRSLASLAVAIREAGHAIRHARRARSEVVRAWLVPIVGIGAGVAWMVVAAGLVLGWAECLVAGLMLVAVVVLLRLATLPIERVAIRRATAALAVAGLLTTDEEAALAPAMRAAGLVPLAETIPNPIAPATRP